MSKPTVQQLSAQISRHEAVCAERWSETLSRIKRLETVLIGSAGAIILLLVGLLAK